MSSTHGTADPHGRYYTPDDLARQLVETRGPRVLSAEPMTGPIDLGRMRCQLGWVIAGCESRNGRPGAPMDLDWVRSLRDQCVAANVPFFFKQSVVGGRVVGTPDLDGRTWTERPEVTRG